MLLLDEPASGQNENETEEFAQILKILNTEGLPFCSLNMICL
ncbi:MAG: hypothetical protein CM15mP49_04970 [Actinomycetota bacterium]|nr:MAG: hypothetical protein CM15mP49_04970 [Actinomycetota bacterium]